MKTITLKLNEITIALHTHEIEGETLYKAQDLLSGYGYDAAKTKATVKDWDAMMTRKSSHHATISIRGRNGGTYLTERQIYKLAAYVDYDFEDVVYEAFRNLVNGNTEQAERLALSVATVHNVMTTRNKKKAIEELFEAQPKKNIYVFVRDFLQLMDNNLEADQSDRVKTTAKLLELISHVEDCVFHEKKKTGNLDIGKITVCQSSKALVREYESVKSRQSLGHQLTRQRNKVTKLQASNQELQEQIKHHVALGNIKDKIVAYHRDNIVEIYSKLAA